MSVNHRITFYNQSRHLMILKVSDRDWNNVADTCMAVDGPSTFSIEPGGSCTVLLQDTNESKHNCWNAAKYLHWEVEENNTTGRSFQYETWKDGGDWVAQVSGDVIYAVTGGSACVNKCSVGRPDEVPVQIYL